MESIYQRLASDRGVRDGRVQERTATIFEIFKGHESVLRELCSDPGRWILWIHVDQIRFPDSTKYRGRSLQFVLMEDGESAIAECRSNHLLDERCRFTADQQDALRAIGWSDPEPPWTRNWYFEAASEGYMAELGRLTERTLREVFGLTDSDVAVVGIQRRFLKSEQR